MSVYDEIGAERARQDAKFGDQTHLPDGYLLASATDLYYAVNQILAPADEAKATCQGAFASGKGDWACILVEEVAEAVEAIGDPEALREELIQVAAVAVAWVEALDRRPASSMRGCGPL